MTCEFEFPLSDVFRKKEELSSFSFRICSRSENDMRSEPSAPHVAVSVPVSSLDLSQ